MQPCKTGDQLYSDASPNGEWSLPTPTLTDFTCVLIFFPSLQNLAKLYTITFKRLSLLLIISFLHRIIKTKWHSTVWIRELDKQATISNNQQILKSKLTDRQARNLD